MKKLLIALFIIFGAFIGVMALMGALIALAPEWTNSIEGLLFMQGLQTIVLFGVTAFVGVWFTEDYVNPLRQMSLNKGLSVQQCFVAFLFAVSYPAIFCIEKGNITIFSIVLVMIFITLRNSEKNLFKELSLIAIAVSAAITTYTLIFALLMFEDKSKKTVLRFIRTCVYFFILFVTPAIFTGFGNLLTYVKAFISVSAEGFIPGNMSIANILHFFGISNTIIVYAIILLTDAIALIAMFMLPSMWQQQHT